MPPRSTGDGTLVYSTNPIAARSPNAAPPPSSVGRVVHVWLEKKGRNGTPVSIIRDLPNDREALRELAARLKRSCGTGGSVKDGEIIIQGDHRARIAGLLVQEGFRVKNAGG